MMADMTTELLCYVQKLQWSVLIRFEQDVIYTELKL